MGSPRRQKRKICVVTGSRADYGHLSWLMKAVKGDSALKLQTVVTGMHLSPAFGSTYKEIEQDGFKIDKRVDILRFGDSEVGIVRSVGIGCQLFADAFKALSPDIIVIFGDRFEMVAATIAAYVLKLPIAHLHGGETTEGLIDEGFRHAITKMAQVHFPATDVYRRRIIQLGEDPKNVFNFGTMGLEALYRSRLLNKNQLEESLDFDLSGQIAICTYHPVTLEKSGPLTQIDNLFKAVQPFGMKVIFTKANADTHGRIINERIRAFCRRDPKRYKFIDSLGQLRYLSCLQNFDLMVGNSSSGIIEAASFKLPVVNIGDRQKGRMRSKNIIDVGYSAREITAGIKKALSPKFRRSLTGLKNPYDLAADGNVSRRIKDKLKSVKLDEALIKKTFFDSKH